MGEEKYNVEEARDDLEQHIRTTRWLRRGLARKLDITKFLSSGAFELVFESFAERRSKQPAVKPYWGGEVDSPRCGEEPDEWQMHVPIRKHFTNDIVVLEVPHTSTVHRCDSCGGTGDSVCSGCDGRGPVTCLTCKGTGRVMCIVCEGATRIIRFSNLHVNFVHCISKATLKQTDVPNRLLSEAQGTLILQQEEDRIFPMSEGAGGAYRGTVRVNPEVHGAINRLIEKQQTSSQEKLHRQRLQVRGLPVHEARYRWGKETRRFWVYGVEKKVYAPRFPVSILRIGLVVLFALGVLFLMLLAIAHRCGLIG